MNFYEMFYLQTQEASMATYFAPAFATLSMRYLEMKQYAIIRNKFNLPVFNYFEQNWKIKTKFNKVKQIGRCFK